MHSSHGRAARRAFTVLATVAALVTVILALSVLQAERTAGQMRRTDRVRFIRRMDLAVESALEEAFAAIAAGSTAGSIELPATRGCFASEALAIDPATATSSRTTTGADSVTFGVVEVRVRVRGTFRCRIVEKRVSARRFFVDEGGRKRVESTDLLRTEVEP